MSNFILAGLFTEGSTDVRFLSSVVERTLEEVAYDCTGDIETMVETISIDKKGLGFVDQVLKASKEGYDKLGILLLFVHTDADSNNAEGVLKNKINPLFEKIVHLEDEVLCRNIVMIVPIHMSESWMLADKDLLKSEIGIDKSDIELGLNANPEQIKDPKALIEGIIRVSKESETKRKRNKGLIISDLYQIIGQKLELSKLEKLPSYSNFKNALIEKLIELNFYHK